MKFHTLRKDNRQKGTALIIAIGLLAVLSILGTVVLTASTRDLSLSGGFLPSRQTFYTADRAVEYAMNPELLFTMKIENEGINLITENAEFDDGVGLTKTHKEIIESFGNGTLVSGTVTRKNDVALEDWTKPEPRENWEAANFHIVVTATGNSPQPSRIDARVRAEKPLAVTGSIEDM